MKLLDNQKGIVLITSLMLTLITLVVVLALLYMITAGTTSSGKLTQYRTSMDASYGGAQIVAKDVIPYILTNYALTPAALVTQMTGATGFQGMIGINAAQAACVQAKLKNATANWPAGCDAIAPASKVPDLTVQLPAANGATPFVVYSKIVSTKLGNSDMGGVNLVGAAVTESGNNVIYPPSQPYLYTIEVQGQKKGDTKISADLEVLYAY